ncbi:MAG: TVP38/TMEM64 family protein [Campylobacteraceae bacterium]|nr:TVP38/TMEM64 family protein [Campylobacteraceae bacterium]
MKTKEKLLKTLVVLSIIICSIYIYYHVNTIKDFILENRDLSVLLYTLAWIVLPIFLFPVPILALVGGVLFGLFWGSVITTLAAMINIILMYYIGRFLGVKNFTMNVKDSFMSVLILRFIPLVPYNLLNYACGFLGIGLKNYILASFVGIIPGTVILINLGENVLNFGSKEFWLSLLYLFILTIISLWLRHVYNNHHPK